MTGAYSGIGVETVKALLSVKGKVILAGRSPVAMEEFVIRTLVEEGGFDESLVDGDGPRTRDKQREKNRSSTSHHQQEATARSTTSPKQRGGGRERTTTAIFSNRRRITRQTEREGERERRMATRRGLHRRRRFCAAGTATRLLATLLLATTTRRMALLLALVLGAVVDVGGGAALAEAAPSCSSAPPPTPLPARGRGAVAAPSSCDAGCNEGDVNVDEDKEDCLVVLWEEEADDPPLFRDCGEEDDGDVKDGRFLGKPRSRKNQRWDEDRDLIWLSGKARIGRQKRRGGSSESRGRRRGSGDDGNAEPPRRPPHPLRTDEWELDFRWKGRRSGSGSSRRRIAFEFADNGYVRCRSCSDDGGVDEDRTGGGEKRRYSVGTWELTPSGVAWTVRFDDGDESEGEAGGGGRCLDFYAGLHLNPFGSHPRFVKGIVVERMEEEEEDGADGEAAEKWKRKRRRRRRNSNWFRPVVGTFKGIGTGEDTVDLTYSDRNRGGGSGNNNNVMGETGQQD